MKIALIEKGHFEVAYTLLSLFDDGQNQITVFIDQDSYHQFEMMLGNKISEYTWVVQQPGEPNRGFITRMFKILEEENFDLYYLDTIEDNFIVYANWIQRLNSHKTILTLHDINGFFDYNPAFSIRRLVRHWGKRKLMKLIPRFNVLSETMKTYLESKLPASKKVFNIPGSFFDPETYTPLDFSAGDQLKLAIPGSIDWRRRNYDQVFDLLSEADRQNFNIKITLLGAFNKGFSEQILERCREHQMEKNNLVIFHTPVVDQPEFDKVISESHFIWMPLQQNTMIADGVTETYGRSTTSGNIADAIRHARPFFSPAHLSLDNNLAKACTRYTDIKELAGALKAMTSEHYQALQQNAYQASLNYTKENIILRNAELFK